MLPFCEIAVIVLLVSVVLSKIKGGTPGRLLSLAITVSLFYTTLSVLRWLMLVIGGLPWFLSVPIITVMLWAVVVAGTMLIATRYEDCVDPADRFMGDGAIPGFISGNLLWSLITAVGIAGLMQFDPLPSVYVGIVALVAIFVCWLYHIADSDAYGQEPADQPQSSDDLPTKMYYDLTVHGLMVGLYLMTWMPCLFLTAINLVVGQSINWTPALVIIICLAVKFIVWIRNKDVETDYAKVYPARTSQSTD